tara:strand:+ start:4062 stop:4367 length:306 start_codon:yes stop_codon:yes gene_type:complete
MKTKEKVLNLLKENASLRDNENKLIATIWDRELEKFGLDWNVRKHFFILFSDGKLTPPTTISRMRRQVQEQNVELRGKHYKGRQTTMQDKWKKELGYEVNK